MEIFIRLSGVELGPYSEEQVRQHIAEGLITLDDPAKLAGMDDWAPLSDILPPEAEPVESAPEPAASAAPETPDEPSEDGPMESPLRAPAPPPGVMHLPSRAQEPDDDEPAPADVGAFAKKTMLIEPTAPNAPIRAPSSGQALGPIATTAPLGSSNAATKKVSRTALVKQIAQKTSPLPTKAINAPPLPPKISQTAPVEAKRDLAGLIKSLTAKTVPMRKGPVPPIGPPPILTTEPMPTRHVTKPAAESAPPPPPFASPAKKESPPPHPEALTPVTIQTTEPMPTRHVFTPASAKKEDARAGAKPAAPPVPESEAPTVKIAPPVLTPAGKPPEPDLEVPTVKIPPPGSKPGEKSSAPPTGPTPAESAPPAKPPESPAPKPRRRLLPLVTVASALLAAATFYYVWSPYHAAGSLRSALNFGDAAGLDVAVDFPSVRAGLKAQISDMVGRAGLRDDQAPAGTKPPSSTVRDVLNNSVDAYMTPEGISALVNKSDVAAKTDASISTDAAAKILLGVNAAPVDNEGMAALGDFVIDRGAAQLHLKFNGVGWKLVHVDLRPDLATPGPNSAAPIVAPVVDTYLDQGRVKARSGDSKGAVADFTQALAIDPKSSAAYNERATIREEKGDLDGAIADYTQALAVDPQMAAAYNGRGNAKASKNDFDGAIADFSQAIQFDPNLATAYDGRGNARIAKDDAASAIADFTQAIAIDPNLAAAYSDRGFARQANGNPDGAIADYTQALALAPKSARTYFNRGLARQAQGDLDAAIIDFGHALDFDPTLADAFYYRGNAKSANHDLDGAISDYQSAIGLNPKLAPAYTNLGLARQAKGDVDGANTAYTQALSIDPKIAVAYFNRSVIEAQKNDLDDAIADSTQALYLDGKNAQAYSTRGFAKLTKGNLDGALTDLKQFCDLAPRDHDTDHVRLYLWLISKAQNSGADADQELSSALGSSWNSAPEDMATKTAGFLLGNTPEAAYLTAAASPDAATDQAQHCQAWYFAGMKRLLMGDKKGAIEAFHQCVATQQKDSTEFVLAQTELKALEPPAPPPAPAPAPPKKP